MRKNGAEQVDYVALEMRIVAQMLYGLPQPSEGADTISGRILRAHPNIDFPRQLASERRKRG